MPSCVAFMFCGMEILGIEFLKRNRVYNRGYGIAQIETEKSGEVLGLSLD